MKNVNKQDLLNDQILILDSQKVAKTVQKAPILPSPSFPSWYHITKTIVHFQIQELDTGTILNYRPHSDFTSFYPHSCLSMCTVYEILSAVWICATITTIKISPPRMSRVQLLYSHTVPASPSSLTWQPLLFSKTTHFFLISRTLYNWNHTECNHLQLAFFFTECNALNIHADCFLYQYFLKLSSIPFSIIHMYHSLFTHSLVEGYLDCSSLGQ